MDKIDKMSDELRRMLCLHPDNKDGLEQLMTRRFRQMGGSDFAQMALLMVCRVIDGEMNRRVLQDAANIKLTTDHAAQAEGKHLEMKIQECIADIINVGGLTDVMIFAHNKETQLCGIFGNNFHPDNLVYLFQVLVDEFTLLVDDIQSGKIKAPPCSVN